MAKYTEKSVSKVKVSNRADWNKRRDNLADDPKKVADKANMKTKNICNDKSHRSNLIQT